MGGGGLVGLITINFVFIQEHNSLNMSGPGLV